MDSAINGINWVFLKTQEEEWEVLNDAYNKLSAIIDQCVAQEEAGQAAAAGQ